MKRIVIVGILLFLFAPVVPAETMYVSDLVEITVRTGQGIDHKIIEMIQSGDEVEVLEKSQQWTMIRTQTGKEGWVLSRFLESELPDSLELNKLSEKYNVLKTQLSPLREEIADLKAENQKLRATLSASEKGKSELKQTYDTLKGESTEYLKLKEKYKKSALLLAKQTHKIEEQDEALSKSLERTHIWWFLSGAGVLLVGFMIGFSARRQRRRSSLL